jgi:hypothetical protein
LPMTHMSPLLNVTARMENFGRVGGGEKKKEIWPGVVARETG